MMQRGLSRCLLLAVCFVLMVYPAAAREPGVPPSVPPGNTIGTPAGAHPPVPGFYLSSKTDLNPLELHSPGSNSAKDVDVIGQALQLLWVPDIEVFGASYMAFVLQAGLYIDDAVDGSEFGLANTEFCPISLSWEISPGLFTSASLSIFAPTGEHNGSVGAGAGHVNTAGDFWTFTPNFAISYLRDGWNATAHAKFFFNTENQETDYRSGDELLLNVTLLKDFGGFKLGPVGYFRTQFGNDKNNGTFFGGTEAGGRAEQLALGVGWSKKFGKTELNINFLHDVYWENTLGGPSLFINVTFPLGEW